MIDKMEEARFVQRERAPDDRRGIYVTITAAGHENVSRVWPDLGTSIHEHFGRHLDEDDAHAIIRALSKVLPRAEGPLVSPRPRKVPWGWIEPLGLKPEAHRSY